LAGKKKFSKFEEKYLKNAKKKEKENLSPGKIVEEEKAIK